MIKLENHMGTITISQEYFSTLIGRTAVSCFGVAGMANSNTRQQLRSFFRKAKSFDDQGVIVSNSANGLNIELHILVTYGLNISEISRSIVNKVRYTVENATGMHVENVRVFVDGMKTVES